MCGVGSVNAVCVSVCVHVYFMCWVGGHRMVEAFPHLNLGFDCTRGWTPALRATVCHFCTFAKSIRRGLRVP